jgi:predicted amidohydrolase
MGREARVACVQLPARDVDRSDAALSEAVELAGAAAGEADLVVLPEATYPGYILHDEGSFRDDSWWRRGLDAFAAVAREGDAYVAVGLIRTVGDRIRNTAAMIGPDGRLMGMADKAFLWHFDSQWFEAGVTGDVLDLSFGPAGMVVCADVRMMEIPRSLAVAGARLLCDTTALVLGPTGLNGQIEYMLEARAWENGSYLAMANKSGYEAGIAQYGGRSAIYGPDGERLVEAPPDGPSVISATVDLDRAPGPSIPRTSDPDRPLADPASDPPIVGILRQPPPARPLRVAFLQRPGDASRMRRELMADLVLTRELSDAEGAISITPRGMTIASVNYPTGALVQLASATVGFLSGDRIGVPEEVRRLMLEGASVVVWDRPADAEVPTAVVRTRADENRIFVIVTGPDGSWQVVGPSGAILAGTRPGELEAVMVELPLALAWMKEMAPTTDVVAGRRPATDPDLV